jgi:hypothetical protein
MSFKHTCKRCNLIIEYETPEELKKYFYFKTCGYFQNVCIQCVKKERAEKYVNGKYKYRLKKENPYERQISIGNNNRGE